MSSVDKSTIEDLQKKEYTLKKCFDRVGKPIIKENYVREFFMKNGLLYSKHLEMTMPATRYPEAVPLKKITTEAVAEALFDIYSRVGIPEEVLTDQGTQFLSECMQEVSTLLNIKVSLVRHTIPFVTDWLKDGTEP